MPGTAPTTTRLAGTVADTNPGYWQSIWNAVTGKSRQAADAVKGVTQGAPTKLGNANAALGRGLLSNSGRVLSAGGVLSLLSAAGELADENDPVLRNVAEAGGNLAGGWGGFAAGATLGTAIGGPLGGLIGGGVGAFYGADALSNAAGGIYDLVANESPQE